MSSLVYPSGNRVKSPANPSVTFNNHVLEEMRDAAYAENENGQGIYFSMTSHENSKWLFLNEVFNQSPLKTTGNQVKTSAFLLESFVFFHLYWLQVGHADKLH